MPNYRCDEKNRNTERQDGMKSQQFNQQVGATTGCTLRLFLDIIPQDL
jgi:hypothetical protein